MASESPRAVLWDLDGVLVDSYEVWFHVLNHTARAFGHPDPADLQCGRRTLEPTDQRLSAPG